MKLKLYASMVLLLLVVAFTVQNVEVVSIRFLFWTFSMSRALLFFFVLAAGILVGWSLCSHQHRSKKRADQAPRPD